MNVESGSTLNLGANLNLPGGTLDVENTGSIVHMNGNNISAGTILLGWDDSQAVTLDRGTTPGSLTATNLYVYGSTLNLLSTDNITNFSLSAATTTLNSGVTVSSLNLYSGSTGTTTTAGNITGNVNVESGSTLNLGANLTLPGGTLDVENTGSIVHMNGKNITPIRSCLGWYDGQAVTLDRGTTPGSLTATNLYLAANTLNLLPTDSITNFSLSGATTTLNSGVTVSSLNLYNGSTGTTTTVGNITGNVNVESGSTLNLGANLNLPSGSLDIENTGSVVHMNGNNISAQTILVGWNDGQAVTLDRGTTPGSLTATNLYVGGNTLNLLAADSTSNLYLSNATVTTAATSNVTSYVEVDRAVPSTSCKPQRELRPRYPQRLDGQRPWFRDHGPATDCGLLRHIRGKPDQHRACEHQLLYLGNGSCADPPRRRRGQRRDLPLSRVRRSRCSKPTEPG